MSRARRSVPGLQRSTQAGPRLANAGPSFAALAATLLLAAGTAQAGALEECTGVTRARAELMACLQAARRQATDRMLESFLEIEQTLGGREPQAARSRALPVLKQSQRDFERYLHAHCQVAQTLATGEGAGPATAACEVDQLRARASALEALVAGQSN